MAPLKNELEDWKMETGVIHLKSRISIIYDLYRLKSSKVLTLKN